MIAHNELKGAWWFHQALFFLLILLSACGGIEGRINKANEISTQSGFENYVINGPAFSIFSAQKLSANPETIHVVIEGDGFAWLNLYQPSDDPTPKNPVALRYAAALADKGDKNVIYLARPCQYVDDSACQLKYWTGERFAPEIITAMNAALDNIKTRTGNTNFILSGYSGGAYIAMRLAAMRNDITVVNTLAGLLDPAAWTDFHEISPLRDIPARTPTNRNVKYHHVCGEDDAVVPCTLAQSFLRQQLASGFNNHVLQIVPGADHVDAWRFTGITDQAHRSFERP